MESKDRWIDERMVRGMSRRTLEGIDQGTVRGMKHWFDGRLEELINCQLKGWRNGSKDREGLIKGH